MTTAIYTRITKTDTRLGVERQLDDCLQLAQQLKLNDTRVYEDNDRSASSAKRARVAYKRLLGDIANGDVRHIVIWHADRLYRRFDDLKDIVDVVEAAGIKISSVKSGEIDLTTPAGRTVARMLGAAAAYEIEHARERIVNEQHQRAISGKPREGGRRAIGWDRVTIDGKLQLVINEREANALRDTARAVPAGASLRHQARVLSAELGRDMAPSVLRKMLIKPSLAGHAVYRGDVIARGKWEPILDEQTHLALVAMLTDSKRLAHVGTARKWLGTGLYVCSVCGEKIKRTAATQRGEALYGCPKFCVARQATRVDALVVEYVTGYLARRDIVAAVASVESSGIDLGPLLDERHALNERLSGLVAAHMAGVLTLEQVTQGTTAGRDRIAEIDTEIGYASSTSAASSVFGSVNPPRAFDDADIETRRAVIAALVTVTLKPAGRGRPAGWKPGQSYFDQNSVDVRLRPELTQDSSL